MKGVIKWILLTIGFLILWNVSDIILIKYDSNKDTYREVGFYIGVLYSIAFEALFGIIEDKGYFERNK